MLSHEKDVALTLISNFLTFKKNLNYVNLSDDNRYLGWVHDFNFKFSDGIRMCLDLKQESDRFLLFVLAIASRTGPWENAAYLVSYLKRNNKDNKEYWLSEENIEYEINNRENSALTIEGDICNSQPRRKIGFRKDIFRSINVLALHWDEIKEQLEKASRAKDFISFMKYLRSIKGLGVNKKQIYIKIPLILRELRCQGIYRDIPGELCCVPDQRVIDACKELEIKLPSRSNDIKGLMKTSSKIFTLFGDLYDLPLFAYKDINKHVDGTQGY